MRSQADWCRLPARRGLAPCLLRGACELAVHRSVKVRVRAAGPPWFALHHSQRSRVAGARLLGDDRRRLRRDRQRPSGRRCGDLRTVLVCHRPARDARVHGADAVVPVEQRRKLLGILGRQPEHDSRLTPGFLERVPHVAGNGRHRIGHQTVRRPPPLPSPLERRCGQLSLEHQFWIPHGEPSPHSDGTFPPDGGPPGVARCASLMPCSAPRTAGSRAGRTQALKRACCGYPSVGMATSMGSRCHRAGAITQSR